MNMVGDCSNIKLKGPTMVKRIRMLLTIVATAALITFLGAPMAMGSWPDCGNACWNTGKECKGLPGYMCVEGECGSWACAYLPGEIHCHYCDMDIIE